MNSERDLPLTVFKPHVQIYAIVEQGSDEYQLLGHGFLAIISDQIENETVHYLEVQSVKDAELLLRSRLKLSNNYQKQRGSVIVWNDSQHKCHYDLAISFETVQQCDIFWYHRRLICEKIGKNYLEISGREALELPSESNLAYILDKTKNSKDLVEYNLLNNPSFASSLFQVFKKFQTKGDKMGMGMVGRIVKSIFNNLDYKMIQALFRDPTFDLILQVQKFLQQIDFPLFWAEKLKIKTIIPLNDQLTNKIRIIHRLSFYRESILDLMRQNNLEQMLVMTQLQFSKDIVSHLTKDNIIDDIVNITYQNTQDQLSLLSSAHKDIAQEETFSSESEDLKKLQFAQKKMEFLLEALIMSKQIQDQNARIRFLDKIYKSKVIEMASQYLDRGVYRAIDFLICLAQSSPSKFIDYLKVKYRQSPSDNLHMKMCRKYNLGNEQMQNLILQIVKYTSQSFRNKQNMDFFNGTFFAIVFIGCKDQKAVLNVLSQVQNNIQNVQAFFGQAVRSKVFQKLAMFLRSQRQEKCTELRAIKILKRVILQNADSSWTFKKVFLQQLNTEIIRSGFFEYCMMVLQKNCRFNNIVCSSMLENLKILSQINRFTKFHKEIQTNYAQLANTIPFISKILQAKQQIAQLNGVQGEQPASHQKQLEQEKEQAYFLSQMQEEGNFTTSNVEQQEQLQNLRKMRREISQQEKDREDSEMSMLSQPSKKVKKSEQIDEQPIMIELDLPFQDLEVDK